MSLYRDDDSNEPTPQPTELTLGSGVIVGGIFGLVLLCGLFFWFGYSMRGGSKNATLPIAPVADPASPDATFSSFKPAAGSPLNATTTPTPAPATASTKTTAATPQSAPVAIRPASPVAIGAPASVAAPGSNGFYVQVAAVSHQPDADKLLGTLRAEGYLVTSRTAPQDNLFHVQIGPYASRKDADLIRQKLAAEGYNPIVK